MMENVNAGLLTLFVVLTIVNVVLNTTRTIVTVKGGIFWSSLVSAIAFGFYTIVIIYTICDLPMWIKAVTTAMANFVGTWFVKWIEMKVRKDKVWMIDLVVFKKNLEYAKGYLNEHGIQFTELPISNSESHLFHIYSHSQDESKTIKHLIEHFNAKYVVMESKSL